MIQGDRSGKVQNEAQGKDQKIDQEGFRNKSSDNISHMFQRMPAFIFYPLACIWSLAYGAIAGACFKLLAVLENWISINRLQILLWKKYPHRSYRKYIDNIWASQIRGQPIEMAKYTRSRIEQAKPREPFPVLRLLINTLFMIFIAPFMTLSGIIGGPIYVFKRQLMLRKKFYSRKENNSGAMSK